MQKANYKTVGTRPKHTQSDMENEKWKHSNCSYYKQKKETNNNKEISKPKSSSFVSIALRMFSNPPGQLNRVQQ